MWEVKYTTLNGSIDFMWYGSCVNQEEAQRRFYSLSETGLEPISLRKIKRLPTDRQYLAMHSKANEDPDRYQVITYRRNSGVDEKRKYASVKKAALAARGYVNGEEPLNCGPIYDGAVVYDSKEQCVVKTYWNMLWGLENGNTDGSLDMKYTSSGRLHLRGSNWKEQLEGHIRLTLAKKLQYKYIGESGGWLGVRESDDTNNDFNREVITAMKQIHGQLYLGSVNYYGKQREQICAETESVYEEYTGQQIFNFHCSFAVPVKDEFLEEMIREWNRGTGALQGKSVEQIMERISELGGEHFIWY